MAVTSSRPGSITINNGAETRTLYGSYKLTISGARTVSVDKGIQVFPPQADGSTVIITPGGTVTGGPEGGSILDAILSSINPPGYAGTDFTKKH